MNCPWWEKFLRPRFTGCLLIPSRSAEIRVEVCLMRVGGNFVAQEEKLVAGLLLCKDGLTF